MAVLPYTSLGYRWEAMIFWGANNVKLIQGNLQGSDFVFIHSRHYKVEIPFCAIATIVNSYTKSISITGHVSEACNMYSYFVNSPSGAPTHCYEHPTVQAFSMQRSKEEEAFLEILS